ncbi:hypothetical protein BN946_scf184411.g6 [Trametes cinnabarina]|uniref:Uncharacterized protein n=1 Tax=Pycnoporus cinnabarinus TaxID=5643 RepID=A0A060SRB4_PYCCI|nr:hypothetical protein BN946_scf184411.g6 [Trametes cinnabarina]
MDSPAHPARRTVETYKNPFVFVPPTPVSSTTPSPNEKNLHTTMRFSAILALVASLGLVSATPSPLTPLSGVHAGDGTVALKSQSGCGSSGPLGTGHFKWWIVATDASGCVPGDSKHIGSMEVDDPNDTFNVARASGTNTLPFTCPSVGQVRCEANFNDNNDGPGYSLRVF